MSEDCLLVDVSVPTIPSNATALPVLVQIHGGGYALGNSQLCPGENLVAHSKGSLIYVSVQYRLGPYGFLSSNALKTDGTANAGLLDQRRALEWVQNHISVFGGDPERVTIIGGSAGGGSVTAQMMLYGASVQDSVPFRAAIAEYPWWQTFHNDAFVEEQYQLFMKSAGCPDLLCMRNISESALQAAAKQTYIDAYDKGYYGYGDFYWAPSVDGDIIRDLPSQAFKRGAISFVPMLTNHAKFEGYTFSNKSEVTTEEEITGLRQLFPNATDAFLIRLFELYPPKSSNSTFWHRQTLFSDAVINCPTQWIADGLGILNKPVYKMIFNAGSGLHGATKPFLFDSGYGSSPQDNLTLARHLRDYYVSFAIHMDPNRESFSGLSKNVKPTWAQYSSANPPRAVLNVEADGISTIGDPDYSERCSFWQSQSAISRN